MERKGGRWGKGWGGIGEGGVVYLHVLGAERAGKVLLDDRKGECDMYLFEGRVALEELYVYCGGVFFCCVDNHLLMQVLFFFLKKVLE